MKCAFISTIGKIRLLIQENKLSSLIKEIESGYLKNFHHYPPPEEIQSWYNSLPILIRGLDRKCDSLPIMVEFMMPIGNERADVLLLGGKNRIIVIELKHWSNRKISKYKEIKNQLVLGEVMAGSMRSHPAYQVEGYAGKLKNFHSICKDFEIKSVVLMTNMNDYKKDHELLEQFGTPIFFKDKTQKFSNYVEDYLYPTQLGLEDAQKFAAGQYNISGRLVGFIKDNQEHIKDSVYSCLAESGFSLTDVQLNIVNEIVFHAKEARKQKEAGNTTIKRVFTINGSPGSGKTLVALTILIEAIGKGIKAIYGLRRNSALLTMLKSAIHINPKKLDENFNDLSGLIYFTNNRDRTGIAENFKIEDLDLIICDEAQRLLNESLPVLSQRAPVVAYFVDETQKLNFDEEGTEQNFKRASSSEGAKYKKLSDLPAGVRCRGGKPYMNFVETLLKEPTELTEDAYNRNTWSDSYDFKIFDDYKIFLNALEDVRDNQGHKIAIVASWTESDGDKDFRINQKSNVTTKNTRIGSNLQSGSQLYADNVDEVFWVMNNQDYVDFWNGRSSDLDLCASIYGTQGFESDYVGFIWGRDLVWDKNIYDWKLGGANTSRDTSFFGDKNKSMKALLNRIDTNQSHSDYPKVKTLMLNRIRIFLTRGILGTYIYAEDPSTREFLMSIQ